MLRDIADCSDHVRFEMAFTAKQMESIAAVEESWDDFWETIAREQLKPIALRAVQGHAHEVTEATPYDQRFDAEDAKGDLRKTKLKHSYDGGRILY